MDGQNEQQGGIDKEELVLQIQNRQLELEILKMQAQLPKQHFESAPIQQALQQAKQAQPQPPPVAQHVPEQKKEEKADLFEQFKSNAQLYIAIFGIGGMAGGAAGFFVGWIVGALF